MSTRTPPTLVQLAIESLLRDQASAIAALEYLPAELFPQMFIQACKSERHQVLKAMTAAWPFTVLPLGSLKPPPPGHDFKAVLDGLDVVLAQEDRPRRCKLRVLDLRNKGPDFWKVWCGDSNQRYSPTYPVTQHRSSPSMEHPLAPVEVFLDLNFNEKHRVVFFMYVINWAQQRKGQLHLCCKTVRIAAVPFQRVRQVLDAVQLDCIQAVEVNCTWDLPTLGKFALYLGQMRNLQRLSLLNIHVLGEEEPDWEEEEELEEEEDLEEEDELDGEEEEELEEEEDLEEEDELDGEEEEELEEEEDLEEEDELDGEEEEELEEEEDLAEEDELDGEEEEELESHVEEEPEWDEEEEQDGDDDDEQDLGEEEEWGREEQEEQISFSQFLSQMISPLHLRELALDSPYFLRGHLHQMLRCLQTPLEKLTISRFRCLTHSDLTHLFQCPNLRQLKSLYLYWASLADFSPEPLRALLEAVAPTLQKLNLEKCALVDSQVEAILPVLSCCHQLSEFSIIENRLSLATVGKLLHHTAGLRSLEYEYYPVPEECYTTQRIVNQDMLAMVQVELKGILRELGQPRTITLATDRGYDQFYDVAFS